MTEITADTVAAAERLAAVDYTPAERQQMRAFGLEPSSVFPLADGSEWKIIYSYNAAIEKSWPHVRVREL